MASWTIAACIVPIESVSKSCWLYIQDQVSRLECQGPFPLGHSPLLFVCLMTSLASFFHFSKLNQPALLQTTAALIGQVPAVNPVLTIVTNPETQAILREQVQEESMGTEFNQRETSCLGARALQGLTLFNLRYLSSQSQIPAGIWPKAQCHPKFLKYQLAPGRDCVNATVQTKGQGVSENPHTLIRPQHPGPDPCDPGRSQGAAHRELLSEPLLTISIASSRPAWAT